MLFFFFWSGRAIHYIWFQCVVRGRGVAAWDEAPHSPVQE